MKRLGMIALVGAALFVVSPVPAALAEHEHFLVNPGTCVEDIGNGQTAIADASQGGYHRFHNNVHIGQPGGNAGQTNTGQAGPLNKDGVAPVVIDKTVGGDAANLAACEGALGG